ncbi:CBS domain-containing protein [Mycolicibacterium sp. HK-90]|uniref:CBS domain-containing protein n=1 Tax=Mycolicibacterium sp. HK-90 TaxID=3056937 RepID=UPI00265AB717|nr:CBS domain-containing protein [Mycolicibacterium sp. HK-90]WKG04636.1 CBS domain-containing protein [Mycolicibacterium sp. HK-90]
MAEVELDEVGELGDQLPSGAGAFLKTVKHKKPQTIAVREFLGFWGYKRRGASIVRVIERALAQRGLTSSPEIVKADYYGDVTILDRRDLAEDADLEIGWPISSVLDVEKELIAVGPDESLIAVETLMVMHDFSQIPVLSKTGRDLYGSVTWKSIARWSGERSEGTARQAMDANSHSAQSSENLLDHIENIIKYEYLYIRDPSNMYVGILTATDLAQSFHSTSGPFIKIGEIESRLRVIVNELPLPVIQQAKQPTDQSRQINDASDLTFGEYVRIIQNPEHWDQLRLPFDRATVVKNLEEVNQIRNDVMHFRPNLDGQTTSAIDRCLNWLRVSRSK